MAVQMITVQDTDNDIRLDRWFARHYPTLKNGQLQRLLRGKHIRVNGKKTTTAQHLMTGDEIRIPPLTVSEKADLPRDISRADADFMQALVLYRDADVLVLNKPAGIAVQGGTKTERHLDGLLDALRFELPKNHTWFTAWTKTPVVFSSWDARPMRRRLCPGPSKTGRRIKYTGPWWWENPSYYRVA